MWQILPIKGGINAVDGFFANGVSGGLKPNGALDIAFISMDMPIKPHTIFTSNTFAAAPIVHFKQNLADKKSNFVLINTKNANAMTGQKGVEDVESILDSLIKRFPKITNPIMSSTGVIGQYLPTQKIIDSFAKFDCGFHLDENLNFSQKQLQDFALNAANAIRTTDSFEKQIALKVILDSGQSFSIGAFAKGAGMIQPAMATMLCYIATDAALPQDSGKEILQECVKSTFNAISVDGDTSTNDSVFLFANEKSGVWDKEAFTEALKLVMHKLATDIVRDGEGSTKLVCFEVINAKNDKEALICAKALANSLLVKTAIFGGDPNWGRIASTIGACGVNASESSLKIYFDSVCVYSCGTIYFDSENEKKAAEVMKQDSFKITCDLGLGQGKFSAYGCDLGHNYVKINADYRS